MVVKFHIRMDREMLLMDVRDFAEYTIDLFSMLVLTDIEESILKGKTSAHKEGKEAISDWLNWLEDNRHHFSDDTVEYIRLLKMNY